jgi:hypothetical protein
MSSIILVLDLVAILATAISAIAVAARMIIGLVTVGP